MLLVHVWWWLQENNLLKAVVAWSVGLLLNSVWAVRLFVRNRKHQKEMLDRLDTQTPGGLGEIKRLLQGEQDPDDNGSDPNDADDHRRANIPGHSSAVWPDIMHGMKGGDSGAGHR
jgi:hypothetical protein